MKILIFIFCILGMGILPCSARLGETLDECHTRYGQPDASKTEDSGRAKHEMFTVGDFSVDIYYLDNVSVRLDYSKTNGLLSTDEVMVIINQKEREGKGWGKPTVMASGGLSITSWERTDGVLAILTVLQNPDSNFLTIISSDSSKSDLAMNTIKAARPATATKGL